MADGELFKPGRFLTHRTQTGAATADSSTINTTNFPPANGFSAYQCQSAWVVWHGTGGSTSDTLKLVPLIWDGIALAWNLFPEITLTKDVMQELVLYGAQLAFLRISNVGGTTATNLVVTLAKAHSEVVE
jgi:hypothetical protein